MFFWQIGATAPAFQGDIEFKNLDGSVFSGKLKGDEWFSWIEDKAGNIVVYNSDKKTYEYGEFIDIDGKTELRSNGIKVGNGPAQTTNNKIDDDKKIVDKKTKLKKLQDIWQRKRVKALGVGGHRQNQPKRTRQP